MWYRLCVDLNFVARAPRLSSSRGLVQPVHNEASTTCYIRLPECSHSCNLALPKCRSTLVETSLHNFSELRCCLDVFSPHLLWLCLQALVLSRVTAAVIEGEAYPTATHACITVCTIPGDANGVHTNGTAHQMATHTRIVPLLG